MDVSSVCPLETWNWDLSLVRFFCLLQGAATAAAKLFMNSEKKTWISRMALKKEDFYQEYSKWRQGWRAAPAAREWGDFFFNQP